MQQLLDQIVKECAPLSEAGHVADYIPELAKANPKSFGAAVTDKNGKQWASGDADETFCLESIAKVVSLALAPQLRGFDDVFDRVGRSAIADPFNSIMRLEMDSPHRPHNPMINSGAIVVVSLLPQEGVGAKIGAVLELCAALSVQKTADVVERVYLSEKFTSDRNRALAYFLRSVGSLEGDVEDTLDVYFRMCSIGTTAKQLSVLGATLACDGRNPLTGRDVVSPTVVRTVRALMMTCGMYDGSGEFAVDVGIPAKSGVGGGIDTPSRAGLAVYGPSLDERGNSVAGVAAMKRLSLEGGFRVI